jgi:post-segregation antitoxin (ccd killing protein)
MPTTTTIKLSVSTADQLRERAKADGVTIEREIAKLLRQDLQRRMGESLASQAPSDEEQDWLDLGARTVAKHAGR